MRRDLDKFVIPPEILLERVREHATWVLKCLSDGTHDRWIPKMYVWTKADPDAEESVDVVVLDVPFNEDDEKHAVMSRLGRDCLAREEIPTCVILSAEAWRSRSPLAAIGTIEPRHDPGRTEGILIQGMAIGPAMAVAMGTIVRIRGKIRISAFDSPAPMLLPGEARMPLLDSFYNGMFEKAFPNRAAKASEN